MFETTVIFLIFHTGNFLAVFFIYLDTLRTIILDSSLSILAHEMLNAGDRTSFSTISTLKIQTNISRTYVFLVHFQRFIIPQGTLYSLTFIFVIGRKYETFRVTYLWHVLWFNCENLKNISRCTQLYYKQQSMLNNWLLTTYKQI